MDNFFQETGYKIVLSLQIVILSKLVDQKEIINKCSFVWNECELGASENERKPFTGRWEEKNKKDKIMLECNCCITLDCDDRSNESKTFQLSTVIRKLTSNLKFCFYRKEFRLYRLIEKIKNTKSKRIHTYINQLIQNNSF